MAIILTPTRLILWSCILMIQVTLFGHTVLMTTDTQNFCESSSVGQHHAAPRNRNIRCQQTPSTAHQLEVNRTAIHLDLKDLAHHPGTRYDQLKLRMPTVYKNVNYTTVTELARPFPIWTKPFPCFPTEPDWYTVMRQKQATDKGFFYFKARKAGSSTVAGVALRIARSKARAVGLPATASNATHCHTRYGHPAAHRLKYHLRKRAESFLWSIVREPTMRDVSEFFHFAVSRGMKMDPSRQAFEAYYSFTPAMQEYYLQFMPTDKKYDVTSKSPVEPVVAKIMSDYDFIGITERMHESLVALQFILNLTTSDILFLSAKTSGGWDDGLAGGNCYHIRKAVVSPQLQEYFYKSGDWRSKTRGGNLLYVAANRSLDLTIASFDATEFQSKLSRYKWALKEVQKRCEGKVMFPCSAGGVLQEKHDCLLWDSGCGYDCLDRVAAELGL